MSKAGRKVRVSISICPTDLECGSEGDVYDKDALLDAIRLYVTDQYESVDIECLQIGYSQGDKWWTVDGDEDAGEDLKFAFFEAHGTDEELFETTEASDG